MRRERDVWCLFGLPFDLLSLRDACAEAVAAVDEKRQTVLSVTNINWVVLASKDAVFCNNIANSDFNFVDGMPLFWCARFLGLPIPERIAGPTLLDHLSKIKKTPRMRVYFFGGAEGTAERACEKINATEFDGAGFCNPGFGDMEEMSREEYLNDINMSSADMLVLSNGAKKGMAWIQANKHKLRVFLIAYLGQVVNLVAGQIKRAPERLQKIGGEWIWRVYQEPVLWKRYFFDGISFLRIFVFRMIPLKASIFLNKKNEEDKQPPAMELAVGGEKNAIFIKGVCNRHSRIAVRRFFLEAAGKDKDIEVRLEELDYGESSFFGNLWILWKAQETNRRELHIRISTSRIKRLFYLYGMERFLRNGGTGEESC